MLRKLILFALLILSISCTPTNTIDTIKMGQEYLIPSHMESNNRSYHLNISKSNTSLVFNKTTPVLVINNQFPGPLIQGKVGDTVNINVTNNIDEPMSIHWHGIQLPNEMDGVVGITQEGIQPGESYSYQFNITDPGTYWYHSHVDTKRHIDMGLQAPFVVHDSEPPAGYSQERVLVLDDLWINETTGEHLPFYYGVMHGRFGNRLLVNGQENPSISINPEGLTRLRFLNTANARSFTIRIPGEKMKIIGKDIGTLAKPREAYTFTIHPGERYDVIANLTEDTTLEYVRRLSTTIASFNMTYAAFGTKRKGKIPKQEELSNVGRVPNYIVDLRGYRDQSRGLVWTLNGKSHPNNPFSLELEEGKAYRIRLRNTQSQPHPMHLHGQKFKVLSKNGEPYEDDAWQDTIMVGSNEVIDIGFIAEGKGTWAFHCHILEHADAGMFGTIEIE